MLINNDTIIKDCDALIRRRSADVPLPLSIIIGICLLIWANWYDCADGR